ncbi:MAG: DUF47 family protein [Acidobacteriota bacterium]|nr:DUF47 family protein [Acidobacteriota bacterium]
MSLNAIMRWLKPRELVFFDLLDEAAANVLASAQFFDQGLRSGDASTWADLRREMKELEHKGDELTHDILDRLNQSFVTPLEREDIMELAHALDDVVDKLDAVAERFVLYRIEAVIPSALELSNLTVQGATELVVLIKSLRTMSDGKEISRRIRHVHTLENQADSVYHSALAQIFEDPKDPVLLIKWKEILDILEEATDDIKLVAQVVGSTIMRNA